MSESSFLLKFKLILCEYGKDIVTVETKSNDLDYLIKEKEKLEKELSSNSNISYLIELIEYIKL